jgi:hypothetical protein
VFWNRRITAVATFPKTFLNGPLPHRKLRLGDDGVLRGAAGLPRHVVISSEVTLAGKRLRFQAREGTVEKGLALWRAESPLRVLTRRSGFTPNDSTYNGHGRLVVYGCTGGTLHFTILVKQPEDVELDVNGSPYQRRTFTTAPDTWSGAIDVAQVEGGKGRCTFDLLSTGLVGTTQFDFERVF